MSIAKIYEEIQTLNDSWVFDDRISRNSGSQVLEDVWISTHTIRD